MAFKLIPLFALMAVANAGFLHAGFQASPAIAYGAPALAKVATPVITKTVDAEFDPHPQYSYNYDVADSITGDYKSQQETRDGDSVQGSYSLLESDGTKRIVDYTADAVNGFNAVVRKEASGLAIKAATPVYQAAPIATKAYAPAQVYAQAYAPAQAYAQAYAPAYAPAQAYAPAAHSVAYAPAVAKYTPALTYGAPAIQKFAAPVVHATAAYAAPAYVAPAVAKYTPALTYGAPATPAVHAAPAVYAQKYQPHPYLAHVAYSSPYYSYSI